VIRMGSEDATGGGTVVLVMQPAETAIAGGNRCRFPLAYVNPGVDDVAGSVSTPTCWARSKGTRTGRACRFLLHRKKIRAPIKTTKATPPIVPPTMALTMLDKKVDNGAVYGAVELPELPELPEVPLEFDGAKVNTSM